MFSWWSIPICATLAGRRCDAISRPGELSNEYPYSIAKIGFDTAENERPLHSLPDRAATQAEPAVAQLSPDVDAAPALGPRAREARAQRGGGVREVHREVVACQPRWLGCG